MKSKIKKFCKKFLNVFMVVGILLSSFPELPFMMQKVNALASVSGDRILETAQGYSSWGYGEVGTCTGLVTRTLNKLGIAESIVGIHPYSPDVKQSGGGSTNTPTVMYQNAISHTNDAKLIWQGYVKDIRGVAGQLKNGDLVIQRPQDLAVPNGFGHVGFIHKYGTYISVFGANNDQDGVGDAVMASDIATIGSSLNIGGQNYISVFRLSGAEPQYAKTSSTKSANETVEVSFRKTDVESGKVLSGVTVDFYRDDEKFATAVTDANGIARATSVKTFTATSSEKEYCTNYDELDEEGRQKVAAKGVYHYLSEAQAVADHEAQVKANALASQKHRFTVVETQTKTKYWLDDNNKTVSDSSTGSGSINVSLTNERVRGTANLKKIDYDSTIAQNEATLDGALYGLYARENILDPADASIIYHAGDEITRVRTENGEASVPDLYLGAYYWKEITPSEGYKLDSTEYDFSLDYAGQNVRVVTSKSTVSERVITGNFEIEKVITDEDDNSGVVKKEKDAEFMVVAKKYVEKYGSIEEAYKHKSEFTNKEYDYLITDKNGYAKSKDLAYGTFVIKQVKGQIDLEMVRDTWEFTVSRENQDTIRYMVNNKVFRSYVKLVKKDAETGKNITLSNTTFKIKNLTTNEYLKQKVGEVTYDEWTTDENGKFVLPLDVKAGTYKLEEIKSPDLYVVNHEGVEFKVTTTNIIETDEDGDPILTVTMYDQPVKGVINVEKHGETLTGVEKDSEGNYKFKYENQCLEGMTVEIKAREDIIDPADGSVRFAKGTIVDTVTTGKTCENQSNQLPLGSYTVYEKTAPEGMLVDEKQYDVDLTFENNETAVVMDTVSVTNERQKVEFDIKKLDKDNKAPIEGVVFGLYTTKDILLPGTDEVLIPEDTLVEKVTSDKSGKLNFKSDLPLSTDGENYFEIREIETKEGYYLGDKKVKINNEYQGQDKKVVSNKDVIYNKAIKNYVLVNKVDALTMENIVSKDFSFNVCSDENCNDVIATYGANKNNGTALIDVRYGTVYIKEASAPLGYDLSDEIVKVTLNSEGLFINDNKVETDEDLTYSIIYKDSLLPVIKTGVNMNKTLYLILGGVSLAGLTILAISILRKKRK